MTETQGRVRPVERPDVAILLCRDHAVICHDVLNAARVWARQGHAADVLALWSDAWPQPNQIDRGVRLIAPRTLGGLLRALAVRCDGAATGAAATGKAPAPSAPSRSRLARAGAAFLHLLQKTEFVLRHTARLLFGGYRIAVACDTPGLIAVRVAKALRGIPYLYHSRELVLSWDLKSRGARAAKRIERACHRAAAFAVIQDERRAGLLALDNGVPLEAFTLVPNAPLGLWTGAASTFLARELGLPPHTPIVLHAGSIVPEHMVLEIIESVGSWPAGPVLVIHGTPAYSYGPQLREAAARFPGRVVFSSAIVPPERVDELFASAAVGLALYRPDGDNFRCVGLAAGKIFNLMKVGVPTIANDLPGLRELLEGRGCGLVVAGPAGIGLAVGRLLADREGFRAACLAAFPPFEFEQNYRAVVRRAVALL